MTHSIGKEAPRFLLRKRCSEVMKKQVALVPGIGTEGQMPKKEMRPVRNHLSNFYAGVSYVGTCSFTYQLHIVSRSIPDHLVFFILFSSHTFKWHLYVQCPTCISCRDHSTDLRTHKSKGTLSISTWMFCRMF